MHSKFTLATLILGALALGVVVYDLVSSSEGPEGVGQPVVSFSAATIDEVLIKDAINSLELKKQEGLWTLASAGGFPADAKKLLQLFDDLGAAKKQRVIKVSDTNKADYGLDAPTTLTFSTGGKAVFSIELGDKRTNGGQYGQVDSSGFLSDKQFNVTPDAEGWELKTLVNVPAEKVRSLALRVARNRWARATRDDKDKDFAATPDSQVANLDPQKLKTIAGLLANNNFSKRFEKSDDAIAGVFAKSQPVAKVELFDGLRYEISTAKRGSKDSPQHFVRFSVTGADKDNAGARRLNSIMQAWVFEVPGYLVEKFNKAEKDLTLAKASTGDKKS